MTPVFNQFIEDSLIVIVIYQTPIQDTIAWRSLINSTDQTLFIYLFDNSIQEQLPPVSTHSVQYHHSKLNVGVGKAYNEAWKVANQLRKKWMLLLDQDTEITTELINAYQQSINQFPSTNFFSPRITDRRGLLSPFRYHNGISRRLSEVGSGVASFKAIRVINSCSLIDTGLFNSVSGYEELLPLDHSDIFFQEKLFRSGNSFVIVDATVQQEFSGSASSQLASRYQIFCTSCVTMSRLTGYTLNFVWVSLKRAVRLSITSGNLKFIGVFLKTWVIR